MKKVAFLVVILLCGIAKSQDTIYSDAYPNGILLRSVDISELSGRKLDFKKDDYEIIIPTSEIIRISNSSGLKFTNKEYTKTGKIVVPIDKESGKIIYTNIIEVAGATKKQLFEVLKAIPNTDVYYTLISKDETDFSVINYRAISNVRFSGDLTTLFYSLSIKIKDGKIKYEMSDFRLYFAEAKHLSGLGNLDYSMGPTNVKNWPLERLYNPGDRKSGNKTWETILKNINTTISSINTCANKAKGGDW